MVPPLIDAHCAVQRTWAEAAEVQESPPKKLRGLTIAARAAQQN
jgi:hypothetical protein